MSETSRSRKRLAEYVDQYNDVGVDVGFGGDPFLSNSICFDLANPYTKVGASVQHLAGDCRSLPFLDCSLDYIYSSHLIEDFTYDEQVDILFHWATKIKVYGRILLVGPDQQKFLQHCKNTGQPLNLAHKEEDYSFGSFVQRVLLPTNQRLYPFKLTRIYGVEDVFDYTWEMILEKKPIHSETDHSNIST